MTICSLNKLIRINESTSLVSIMKLKDTCTNTVNHYLHIPNFSLKHYQNCYCYQAPKLWNYLSGSKSYCGEITVAPTLNSTKSRLKKFLLQMQSYGSETEWIIANRDIYTYLTLIKNDPYYEAV